MPSATFEPAVTLPADPIGAAYTFLSVMASPEAGARRPGKQGAEFLSALFSYRFWCMSRLHGEAACARAFRYPAWRAPTLRSFERPLERGFRRVWRRLAVAELNSERINLVMQGHPLSDYADAEVASAIEPWGKTLGRKLEHWEQHTALNETLAFERKGESRQIRVDSLMNRRVRPSVCTLHMAYGILLSLADLKERGGLPAGPKPLSFLALCPEAWIETAIEEAVRWREPILPFVGHPPPEAMIELRRGGPEKVWATQALSSAD